MGEVSALNTILKFLTTGRDPIYYVVASSALEIFYLQVFVQEYKETDALKMSTIVLNHGKCTIYEICAKMQMYHIN